MVLILSALTTSCASDNIVRLDLPVQEDTKSFVLAVEHEASIEVTAHDRDAPGALPVLNPFDTQARITLALYAQTLEELGLPPGKLEHEPDVLRAHPLAPPDALFESLVSSQSREWVAIEAPSPAFTAFRITGPELCETFEAQPVMPLITEDVYALARLRDGKVLAVSKASRFFMIDENGATRLQVQIQRPFEALAAVEVGSGEIWISGKAGQVRRGTLATGFVAVETGTTADFWAIDGAKGDAEEEIFVFSNNGVFLRYFGGQWEPLRTTGLPLPSEETSVTWVKSGVAIATSTELGSFLQYDAASATKLEEERIAILYGDGTVVEHVDELGTILTTKLHRIFRITTHLEDLGFVPYSDTLTSVVGYRDSFVTVGNSGSIFQFRPGVECPITDIMEPNAGFKSAEKLGDDKLILSGHQKTSTENVTVFMVRPRATPR